MRHSTRAIALAIPMIVSLTGCAGTPSRDDVVEADQATLVAEDFVSALAQLRGFSPRNTTLQMRPVSSEFGNQLASELRRAGFGMQRVPEDDTGPLLVTYEAEGFESEDAHSVGYRVRVGSVELGRAYEIRGGRVFPMTALSVRGTRISEEPLDDTIFDRNVASEADAKKQRDAVLDGPASRRTQDGKATGQSILDDETLPDTGWQEVPASASGSGTGGKERSKTPVPTDKSSLDDGFQARNLADVLAIGGERFAPLAGQAIAEQVILTFDDDSTRLSASNQQALLALTKDFDPQQDLISVIGCSHGPTGAPGRNRALAIGRADRVRVELIAQGVNAHKVLDEGCFSAQAKPGMPGRAVVVSVHRRTTA